MAVHSKSRGGENVLRLHERAKKQHFLRNEAVFWMAGNGGMRFVGSAFTVHCGLRGSEEWGEGWLSE
jgi:hypothetical protein